MFAVRTHQVSVRVFAKRIYGRGLIHDQSSGAIRPVTAGFCKGQGGFDIDSICRLGTGGNKQRYDQNTGTFSMCMEKSLQVFRRPGWPNLVKSNAPKDELGGARGCTKDGMAKLANQMENRRKARTCRELKTAASWQIFDV